MLKHWGDFGVHLQNLTFSVKVIDHNIKVQANRCGWNC